MGEMDNLVLATVNNTRVGLIWLQKLGTFELRSRFKIY
jgi:hypothetical protein